MAEVIVPAAVPLKGLGLFAVTGDYLVVQSPDNLGNPQVTPFKVRWH